MEEIIVHGYNATITLTESGVKIKPGVVGNIFGGGSFLSEKFIPYEAVTGVELRKGFPLIGEGVLQINTKGEVENMHNNGDSLETNSIRFQATLNKNFEMISQEILKRISIPKS